ncbi:hypothetical protein C8F01DRAFT_1200015, partial [Mycena amicta]
MLTSPALPASVFRDIDRILLKVVPWDARKEGGTRLQACLHELWSLATRVSSRASSAPLQVPDADEFTKEHLHQEDLEELDAAHKKVLFEVDTRWMYPAEEGKPTPLHKALKSLSGSALEIGFRHGRSRVSAPPLPVSARPIPKPRVLADIAVQTKTKVPSDTLPEPTPSNWADDSASLPIFSLSVASPPSNEPWDLSALRSSTSAPFASLQRCRHHQNGAQRRMRTGAKNPRDHPPPPSLSRPRRPRSAHTTAKPTTSSTPSSTEPLSAPVPGSARLNWAHDPRLRRLSQALVGLG